MGDISGKACLVTGASRGIGRAIALELGRHGANVAVGYARSEDAAAEVVEGDHRRAVRRHLRLPATCRIPQPSRASCRPVLERFGKIDILVNNAGITRDRSLAKMTVGGVGRRPRARTSAASST